MTPFTLGIQSRLILICSNVWSILDGYNEVLCIFLTKQPISFGNTLKCNYMNACLICTINKVAVKNTLPHYVCIYYINVNINLFRCRWDSKGYTKMRVLKWLEAASKQNNHWKFWRLNLFYWHIWLINMKITLNLTLKFNNI